MDYSEFSQRSKDELNIIYDLIDKSDFSGDFDLINDILHIYSEDGEYVINQHSSTKQIWLSSPVSNAGYFNFHAETNHWIDKNGGTLRQRICSDLKI
jgi:frataxin-like iron-binding protein CyaY